MAPKRIVAIDEAAFRRIREAVRKVERTPTTGSQRRRQVPVMGDEGTSSGGGGGGGSTSCSPCGQRITTGIREVGGVKLPDVWIITGELATALGVDALDVPWDEVADDGTYEASVEYECP